jgi:hypothetical protein
LILAQNKKYKVDVENFEIESQTAANLIYFSSENLGDLG